MNKICVFVILRDCFEALLGYWQLQRQNMEPIIYLYHVMGFYTLISVVITLFDKIDLWKNFTIIRLASWKTSMSAWST